MELDFLGLNLKETLAVVKEEAPDGSKDQASTRGAGMQWLFSKKVSVLPPSMSYMAVQEEKPKKILFDSLTTSAFQPVTTASVFDSTHNGLAVSQSCEIRGPPVLHSRQSFPAPMANPFFKIHCASGGTNMIKNIPANEHHQELRGIPLANLQHIVPMGSVAGTYASKNPSKPVSASAQLTVFYAGTVNVYNDIPAEKVQEIMRLASSGSSMVANATIPRAPVQASTPKCARSDGIHGSQSQASSPCSRLSSPVSASSHVGSHLSGVSSNTKDLMVMKSVGSLPSRMQAEPPKVISTLGFPAQPESPCLPSLSGPATTPTVPQARKASLARFLEKRKERVVNAAPYSCNKSIKDLPGSDVSGLAFERHTLSSMKQQS